MNTPNEAWRAAEKANRVASESERVTAIVAAAATHIARAAQVAVLRDVRARIEGLTRYASLAGTTVRLADVLTALEAGAGQTGETQGKAAWERANGTNGPFGWEHLAEDEKVAWRAEAVATAWAQSKGPEEWAEHLDRLGGTEEYFDA